ncbi:MAG TPA: hypothetical protein VMJ65_11480 [Solirubrobacteraceae bacterium]|nr:hypothetical protein [Solirubrobacteraceae bacterium]
MSVADLERISYPSLSLRPTRSLWTRIHLALIAGWRAGELDSQLAAGTSPSADAPLAIRARRLTSRRHRARVAAGLARAVRDAETTTRGFSAAIRPDRREVIAARTVLATLDRRLRGGEPVSPQGVALLESLLTDGTSALYRPAEPGALGSRLRAAAAALEPPARRDAVRARQEALG